MRRDLRNISKLLSIKETSHDYWLKFDSEKSKAKILAVSNRNLESY